MRGFERTPSFFIANSFYMNILDSPLVAIERRSGVTLYGRKVNKSGKLGQFEVHSNYLGHDGKVFATYSEAEVRMNTLAGIKKP